VVRQPEWRQRVSSLYVIQSLCISTNIFRHTLIPPRGYTIGGLSGSCADWLDGFALIITR
jgi:hypothetical protein